MYMWNAQDIADAAYRKRRGRPQLPGLGKVVADVLFSLLLQGLFLIQVNITSSAPVITLIHLNTLFISEELVCLVLSCYVNNSMNKKGARLVPS